MAEQSETLSHKTPVRAIVAGTGHGLRVLVPAMTASGFDVVALVGANAQRTQERASANGIARSFTDLDQAIKETGAQAVAIATPPHTHADLVFTALRHGCHVLCEKPFARNAAEATAMRMAAEAAGVVHLLGNQFRMVPDRTLVAQALTDGLIGEPRLVSISQFVNLVADPAAPRPDWWFDQTAGGGWLGASGSHMLDMIRLWLGDFAAVSGKLQIVSERAGVAEDSYLTRFTMTSGVEGVLMQTGGAWGEHTAMVRIAGTRGTLSVEGGKVLLSDRDGTRELQVPDELRLPRVEPSTDPGKRFLHIELPPALRLCQAWHNAIHRRVTGPVPLATFADGEAVMQVTDAIRASSAAGGELITIGESAS